MARDDNAPASQRNDRAELRWVLRMEGDAAAEGSPQSQSATNEEDSAEVKSLKLQIEGLTLEGDEMKVFAP